MLGLTLVEENKNETLNRLLLEADKLENVAIPLTAVAVVVPESVQLEALDPVLATEITSFAVVTKLLYASVI